MSSDLHKFFLLIVVVSAVFCLIKYTLANNECQQSCWRMNLVCQRKCASNNSFTNARRVAIKSVYQKMYASTIKHSVIIVAGEQTLSVFESVLATIPLQNARRVAIK
uniref:Hypotheticial protein n=1 Tax=Schistosoma japonicum TaxID=6182 RepID=C7TZB0_SCHJA|nr:hypotheticial protein [Schistosoma japonicum]